MSGLIEACKHQNNNLVCIHIYIYTHTYRLLHMKPALLFLKQKILLLKKSTSKSLDSQTALVLCVLYFDSEE